MTREEIEARVTQIGVALSSFQVAWPHLAREVGALIDNLTEQLVADDNEQTRGRIKALRDLLNLPETLQHERDGITAELSGEPDSAL